MSSLTIFFPILVFLQRALLSLLLLLQPVLDETLLVGVEEDVGEASRAAPRALRSPVCTSLHGLLGALQHLQYE